MRRIVIKFGLISGGILAASMLVSSVFMDQIGFGVAEVLGYSTMLVSFLMVYFGIRAYRDNVLSGSITFGRAFKTGLLIMLISCACYAATWQFVYYRLAPDFVEKYSAHQLEKARAAGASQAALAAQARDMQKFQEMYRNPLVNVAITFIEPVPLGLLLTLVSAVVLSRKRKVANIPGRVSVPAG